VLDAERRGQGRDDLAEAARDEAHGPAGRVHGLDELAGARREGDPRAHLVEHTDVQAGQRGHALAQARGEVELAAHRPLGHRGHLLPRARVLGEQLDDLGRDERGVDVGDQEPDAVDGKGAGGHGDVHAERRRRAAQLGRGALRARAGPQGTGEGEAVPAVP
jgi:hypothetical protein